MQGTDYTADGRDENPDSIGEGTQVLAQQERIVLLKFTGQSLGRAGTTGATTGSQEGYTSKPLPSTTSVLTG